MTTVTLVIPSFGRPADLDAALTSAMRQSSPFEEIIVVARNEDIETITTAQSHNVDLVIVSKPGVLAAMVAGTKRATSDIVAFTDDDARLPPDHAARLRVYFHDLSVDGVGGRDVLYDGAIVRNVSLTNMVGRIRWYGRVVGNHHRGEGSIRPVFMLKGVNAAYRRTALAFPLGLRGDGAQPHFEVALGSWFSSQRGTLLYDPSLEVAHHPAKRLGDDQRTSPSRQAIFDSAYNLARSLPPRLLLRRLVYVVLLGDTNCPGIARWLVAVLRRERSVRIRLRPTWRGTYMAWTDRRVPLAYERCSE
jgi:glycosyltransferase involved in cell wall biosynthesis